MAFNQVDRFHFLQVKAGSKYLFDHILQSDCKSQKNLKKSLENSGEYLAAVMDFFETFWGYAIL